VTSSAKIKQVEFSCLFYTKPIGIFSPFFFLFRCQHKKAKPPKDGLALSADKVKISTDKGYIVLFASRRTGDQPVRIVSKQRINHCSVRGLSLLR
jgi:hypothetical protein